MGEQVTVPGAGRPSFIRLGGFAIIAGMAIHIVLNMVLKEFPPEDPTLSELQAYLSSEAGNWAIVHGCRYLAFTCIVLFAAALFERTCRLKPDGQYGWGVVGLLGASIFAANGVITNGVEILAFLNGPPVNHAQDLFQLLFRITRVLFTAEVVAWSILILGFSVAGWLSATLPRWISWLGFLQVAAGMVAGVLIVPSLRGEVTLVPLDVASIAGLVWFVSAGAFLLVRGDSV